MSLRLKDVGGNLQELLDWMAQTEQKLGAQQPINEQIKPLTSQLNRHKVGVVLDQSTEAGRENSLVPFMYKMIPVWSRFICFI